MRQVGQILLVVVLAAGCGTRPAAREAVHGHVTFRGTPLAGGTIVFSPDPEHGGQGPLAMANIGKDGSYVLHTGEDEGAVAGWYRIAVAPETFRNLDANTLPHHYTDPNTSGESREVKPGQINVVDLTLK